MGFLFNKIIIVFETYYENHTWYFYISFELYAKLKFPLFSILCWAWWWADVLKTGVHRRDTTGWRLRAKDDELKPDKTTLAFSEQRGNAPIFNFYAVLRPLVASISHVCRMTAQWFLINRMSEWMQTSAWCGASAQLFRERIHLGGNQLFVWPFSHCITLIS